MDDIKLSEKELQKMLTEDMFNPYNLVKDPSASELLLFQNIKEWNDAVSLLLRTQVWYGACKRIHTIQ